MSKARRKSEAPADIKGAVTMDGFGTWRAGTCTRCLEHRLVCGIPGNRPCSPCWNTGAPRRARPKAEPAEAPALFDPAPYDRRPR